MDQSESGPGLFLCAIVNATQFMRNVIGLIGHF